MSQATIVPEQVDETTLLLRLSGEVDLANAADVSDDMLALVANTVHAVVVDLSGATYLDSSGIQMLFDVADALQSRQQHLRVVVPAGTVLHEVLELVHFGDLAGLDMDLAGALAVLKATA